MRFPRQWLWCAIAVLGDGKLRYLILDWLKGGIAARHGKFADHFVTKLASSVRWLTHLLPQPQVLRHATRMTVAAVLAFAAAWAFALPEGYWAVISAVVVMQSSLGGTLGASLDRLMATVAGAMVGAACVFLRGRTPLPEVLVLTLAVGPTREAIETGAAGVLDGLGKVPTAHLTDANAPRTTHRYTERVGAPAPYSGHHSGGRGCTGAGALFGDRPTGRTPVADLA
jgi:hypothetical protein